MKRKLFQRLIVIFFITTLIFVLPAYAAEKKAKVLNLRCQAFAPASMDLFSEILASSFPARVKELTDGAINIQVFPGGALVPTSQIFGAVGKRMVDMAMHVAAYVTGVIPIANIESGLPLSWADETEVQGFFYHTKFRDLLIAAYAKHNVRWNGTFNGGPQNIISKKPINSLADLKKLRVRISGPAKEMLKKLDVPLTYVAGSELYLALSTGTIDAAVWGSASTAMDMNLHEVAKYFLTTPLSPGVNGNILTNLDVWKSFSPSQQAAIDVAGRIAMHDAVELFTRRDKAALAKMSSTYGVTLTSLPPAEVALLNEAAQSVWDDMAAKSPDSAEAVQILRDYLKK